MYPFVFGHRREWTEDPALASTAKHESGHALIGLLQERTINRWRIGMRHPDNEDSSDVHHGEVIITYPNDVGTEEYINILSGAAAEGKKTFLDEDEKILEPSDIPAYRGYDLADACRYIQRKIEGMLRPWNEERVAHALEQTY